MCIHVCMLLEYVYGMCVERGGGECVCGWMCIPCTCTGEREKLTINVHSTGTE